MRYPLLILLTFLMKVAEVQGQCGRPSVGANMVIINDVSNQTFPNGSTITFKCITGYVPVIPSASKTIICVGTEWTKLELNCTKKTCGSLPDIANGKYTYPDGNLFGATAIAVCNEGHTLVGEKTRNCRENGWDGRDPVCEVVKCEPPPTIQNGTYEPIDEFYNYNHAVTYSCSKGYTLFGESTIACLANGTFPSPPQCLFVECETPYIPNAIRVEGKSPPYGYGDFVRYVCNTGYTMDGEGHLVCDLNGWNPSPPKCIKDCEPLPDIPNGKYTYPDGNMFGATAVAECNEGYSLVGEKTRKCRENGWDGRDPVCEVVKCKPPPTIQNGTYDPIMEFYNYHQTVTYTCSKGYIPVGESTIACLANGTFPSPPRCLLVKCEPPPTIQNGTYDPIDEFYNYNQTVTYSCSKGYTLFGESTIACLANGTFPSPPQCLFVECETPNITNAVRVEGKSPPYGYGDFVRYECNTGYTMDGQGHLVCDVNRWNPSPPKCIITSSSTTSHPSYGITMIAFLVSIVVLLGPEH